MSRNAIKKIGLHPEAGRISNDSRGPGAGHDSSSGLADDVDNRQVQTDDDPTDHAPQNHDQ
jgi:hypothetical protein